jgi:glycosyltransferase involved in cell wall biosynthesis
LLSWYLIAPEYPPARGGVADYTRLVALELAARGDRVHVWAPAVSAADVPESGVEVHRLPGRFGPRALAALGRGLNAAGAGHILLEYVPHGFGMRAMNLPFCLWLHVHRRADITIMFHEVALPLTRSQPLRHNVIALFNRAMAFVLARAARRCFVAAAGWELLLRPLVPAGSAISWLPVPSNVPLVDDPAGVRTIRKRLAVEGGLILGHFGTAREAWIVATVEALAPALLRERPDATLLLLGRDSLELRDRLSSEAPALRDRVQATGPLAPDNLSRHLGACDLMLQPYGEGVSTRRTSVMAALAHSRPVVTTSGVLTEPLWAQSRAVALAPGVEPAALGSMVKQLIDDAGERARLGRAAGALYADRFDLTHTIAALRAEYLSQSTHE